MTVEIDMPTPARRFGRLGLLFLAHAAGTASIALVLAKAPAVEESLGLSHAEFGMMVSAYFGANFACALPAGWMVDRYGIRAMLLTAHLLLAVGLAVFAQAQGLPTAIFGLALCGSGYALINPSTARGVLTWFPPQGRATAMGVKQTGVPAGGAIVALFAAAGGMEWHEMAIAIAAMTLLIGMSFLTLQSARSSVSQMVPTRFGAIRTLLWQPQLVLFNGAACLYSAGQAVFFAYLVLYARDVLDGSAAQASLCLAVAYVASAGGRIGWGIVSDVLAPHGRTVSLTLCGAIGVVGLTILLLLPAFGGLALLTGVSALLGMTLGGYAGLTQTAAAEAVEPHRAGASIGYNMLLTSAGNMLGPVTFGVGVEQLGYGPAWGMLAVTLALGAALFYASTRLQIKASRPKSSESERTS
ncbi:MAG: MFS transporter [Alphaproteobacteria bacterium]|nr:MFS transporter [Alphaproteobacteria bacterium]